MHHRQPNRPAGLPGEQTLNNFRRKGRKGSQAAEEAGNRKKLQGQREMGVDMKQANSDTDQITTNHIGRQRTEGQCYE